MATTTSATSATTASTTGATSTAATYAAATYATATYATATHATATHATATNATATNAAATWYEYPAYNSLRYSLQRMWNRSRSILAILPNLWEYEFECTPLIATREEDSRLSDTSIV